MASASVPAGASSSAAAASSPPAPAVTNATASSNDELVEAIRHFLSTPPDQLIFQRAEGGVNNKCTFVIPVVKDGTGTEYLLRIYNNGNNDARVEYEHAVLQLLSKKKFSFQLPEPLPLLEDSTRTTVRLKSGASACLFKRIRGGAADNNSLAHAHAIGKATAEVVSGMADISVPLKLPNPLYRNMYDAHHFITRETFYELLRGPRCDHVRAAADALLKELDVIEALITRILEMKPTLPEQQIHADLHFSNVLVHGDIVSGVLDFEFCAPDWRAMELVVGLSKYIAINNAEKLFEEWVKGYKAGGGRLTPLEAQLVPDLIILRVLNNVIYFAGRALAGEDDLAALTTRMDMYNARCIWIRERADWMRQVLTKTLVDEPAAASEAK